VRSRKKTSLARSLLLINPSLSKRSLAKTLGISRASLYHHSKQKEKDEKLLQEILAALSEHPHYGHRRIALVLSIGKDRARRVMRRYGLKLQRRKRRQNYKRTKGNSAIPNRIKGILICSPNQVWAGDFTELTYKGIILYLATVIDLYTREIVGVSIGLRHSANLVVSALADAKAKRNTIIPSIFHSDQGSEYESGLCALWLLEHQIIPSRSVKAHPWENGKQESFYGRFKEELGNLSRLPTLEDALASVHAHIFYYNTKRIHSALKMPPRSFYEQWRKTLKLLPAPQSVLNHLSTPV
jgi:putative transposase